VARYFQKKKKNEERFSHASGAIDGKTCENSKAEKWWLVLL